MKDEKTEEDHHLIASKEWMHEKAQDSFSSFRLSHLVLFRRPRGSRDTIVRFLQQVMTDEKAQ